MSDKRRCGRAAILAVAALAISAASCRTAAADEQALFRPLFDGRSLDGWESPDMSYWSVENGAITGKITEGHPLKTNQYLIVRDIPKGKYKILTHEGTALVEVK